MNFKATVYEVPLDTSSDKYKYCLNEIKLAYRNSDALRYVNAEEWYFLNCFENISKKLKHIPLTATTQFGDVYGPRAEHTVFFGGGKHIIQLLKEPDNARGRSRVFVSYLPTSMHKKLFKPEYLKEIAKEYKLKKVDKKTRDAIRESLTLDELLARI
jgi:hypothetical protein